MNKEEFQAIENLFREHSNSEKAMAMEAYMKNKFKFMGINAPTRKLILRKIFSGYKWKRQEMLEFSKFCWDAEYRELQHAALDILKSHAKKLSLEDLPYLEKLVVSKSWWDTVDVLAVHPIGKLLKTDMDARIKWVLKWVDSDNLWLRRTAILHQLKYKHEVDHDLLELTLKKANGTKEFFLNKAIGWMLREYSRINPQFVKSFCENNDLSNLSRREALRLI